MADLNLKWRNKLVTLVILISMCFAQDEYTLLKPKNELKNQTIPNLTDYKYYKFVVDSFFNNKKDIAISTTLTEDNPWANPDIYLAKDIQKPNVTNFQIACNSFGEDICTINKNELKANETWYLGVNCGGTNSRGKTCSYDISMEYIDEIIIEDGVSVTVYLYENEEKIFKYFVPDDNDIRHVQISSRAQESISKFEMLTVKGNDPPGTDRRRHSWPAWNNGYVSRFEPGCDCFCVNCNYTSLVRAETPGYYTVTAKHSKVIEEIKTGEVYDNVFRWRNNCYKYYVKDPYNDFRVKLKVYSGDPDIYVHPKNLPENIIQFKYNSLESMESEELVLSPKMRTDDGNIVGDYFICVQGKTTSSFKLELKNDDKTSFILESGVGEAGYLEKGEMVNYWYRDDILKSKTNVTFQLHAMSGSSTLRTKYCKATDDFEQTKSNCIHSIDELKKPIANEKVFNLIGSETIEHDPKDCNNVNPLLNLIRKSSPTCIYNIGIIGNSDGLNHYAVTVRHDEGHHVLLFEGKTFEGSLSQGDFDYYKISINDDKISKLTIQLLTVHGDPDLYVSTKDQFPSEAAFERRATICGRFPDTIEYTVGENNSTDLVGNYYVSVFGSQDSSYHLYYHTERLEQNEKGQEEKIKLPVKLNQGKPVLGVLKSKSDYLLYKFNIANITNEEEIIVQLLPQNGKFNFTVKNKGEATLTNFDKIGGFNNHYTVFFDPIKEPQFKNGEFNIYVYPIVTEDLDTSGMSFTFLINYFIGSHHITLLDGQQTMGFVKDEKINYYSYLFKNNINELKLTITKIIGNVNAVISLNQAILFPTENELSDTNGIFKATSEKTSFSKSRLSEFCANEDGKYCIMTVGVYSAVEAGKESQYVVTAKGVIPNVTPVLKVENGIPQHGYSLADEWQYYYYKTSNSTPAYAVVVPSVGNPNLYVSILSDLSLKESEWNKPTFTSNLKKSEDSVGADILLLTEKDLKNCSSSCVLIFGIVSEKANTNYTFTVTRGISILKENVAYTDSLSAEGNYNFYEYYRSCSGCTTVISISSFVQNPYNIYVNFNTTERFSKHENKNTADFSKSGRNSESLVISPEVLKLKGYKDEPGYFFIEVNSDSLLNYTITAISNDFKVFPLNKGIPSTYNIKDVNQQLYYSYLHESNNGFSIQVQEDFGFVELLINTAEESDSKISEKLPIDQEHSKWSTHQQSVRGEIEIKPDDKMFCFKCIYLIKIESKTASRGTISVQETGLQSNPNKITILKIGYPTTINIEPFGFTHCKFIVPDLSPINIDLNTLLGDVEYELTNTKVSEKNFGTFTDSNRNGTLIHYGKGLEESYIFNQQNKLFKTGSIYYLTIKSMTEYSKVILTLSHVGRYSAITESTPQKVRMDGSIKLFYYLVDPNPGKSKYIIEALPTNQKEKFTVFVKIASIPEENNPNEIDISPKWQISAEEIIKSKDYKIWFQNQQSKQNHISFDIEVVQSDLNKVVLLAVKSENEKPLGSTVNLYVASNNIQPLKLGVSHFGSVDNKDGIYKIYEAYIPKSQNETYVVELTPCQGKAEMFISKDIRRFNNKQYDSDSTKLTNGRLYAVLKSESESISKYIIVVKSLNNATNEYKSLETTQFKIEARRYPTLLAKKTYVEKYFVPNEGEIDWKVSDDGKYFDISWPRIYNIEGSNELPTAYTNYDIYINKEDRSGLESPCSITQLFTPINEISVDQNSYKIKIDDYVETEDIYINVIGHVTQDDTQDLSSYIDYPIAYRPLKIHMDNVSYDDGSDFLFWLITITIILALLILLLFLYRKYRRVKHKLATEVREVNQIEYGTELKPTKVYNRFPDENSQQDAKV